MDEFFGEVIDQCHEAGVINDAQAQTARQGLLVVFAPEARLFVFQPRLDPPPVDEEALAAFQYADAAFRAFHWAMTNVGPQNKLIDALVQAWRDRKE